MGPILERLGYKLERAKTNVGLGRITNPAEEKKEPAGDAFMTNTLHRYGDAQSFFDDYVVFAIPSRGKNDQGSVPKLKKFLEMALPFQPVNLGDAIHGGALRPSRNMHPTAHWNRDMTPDFRAVIDGVDAPTTVAAVFDKRVAAEDFVKTVRAADLGLCINISTSIDGAEQCCHAAGHSAPQRRLLAGLRGQDREAAQQPGPDADHHVRPRHDLRPAWPRK